MRLAGLLAIVALLASAGGTSARQQPRIPDRLADSTYWRIVSQFSEPSGYFLSENFVSNETEWQTVIPSAAPILKPTDAYLGVGPEQNFTYIAAFKPKIAFITDIRRQNLIQHLMYKALFEMSADRAEFLSKLWSRPRPPGLDSASTPEMLLAAFQRVHVDTMLQHATVAAMFDRLVNQRRFTLSSDDSATIRTVHAVFAFDGPEISYASRSRNTRIVTQTPATILPGTTGSVTISVNGAANTWFLRTDSGGVMRAYRDSSGVMILDSTFSRANNPPMQTFISMSGFASFGTLMTQTDGAGTNRGWLATEANWRWLRDFQQKNLLVPVVGDFAGPKALRAIGQYLKENNTRVGAFYTSNVEQYLFQNGVDAKFYENVGTLPTDSASLFIRSFPNMYNNILPGRRPGARLAQTISSVQSILAAYKAGQILSYRDLSAMARP